MLSFISMVPALLVSLTLLSSQAPLAVAAPATSPRRRAPSPLSSCASTSSTVCNQLLLSCISTSSSPLASVAASPWSQSSCVAAATCSSVGKVLDAFVCAGVASVPSAGSLPNLDYNVYASIAGSCAWNQGGGCAITSDAYANFIYSSLNTAQASTWPASTDAVKKSYFVPIATWTKTSAVPYSNFNDWLHWSTDKSVVGGTTRSNTVTTYVTDRASIIASLTRTTTETTTINPTQAVVKSVKYREYVLQASAKLVPLVYGVNAAGATVTTVTRSASTTRLLATTTFSTPRTISTIALRAGTSTARTTIPTTSQTTSVTPTPTSVAPSVATPAVSFTAVGCWTDNSNTRSLGNMLFSGATVDTCAARAKAAGYSYFGLQYAGECWADNTVANSAAQPSACSMACSANSAQICGGNWAISLYQMAGAASSTPAAPFTSVGCWTDNSATRSLSNMLFSGATVDTCAARAQAANYAYFGLQYAGECWAGDSVANSAAPASACSMACTANSAQTCGGNWAISLYQVSGAASLSSVTVATSSSTAVASSPTGKSCAAANSVTPDPVCNTLLNACMITGAYANPWSNSACVAAAMCAGPAQVIALYQKCYTVKLSAVSTYSLDHNVFVSITDDCSSNTCAISQQNFIDFMYAQLAAAQSAAWPSSPNSLVSAYWNPITSWTASSTVPEKNFQDFLKWYTPAASPWTLTENWNGYSFFNGWGFWGDLTTYGDPTHGTVNYVGASQAWNEGLVSFGSSGNPIIRVSTQQKVNNVRNSVRLQSWKNYNVGTLVLWDVVHVPTGPATWPALWSSGGSWPTEGEIDVFESTHSAQLGFSAFHTNPGCTMDTSVPFSGTLADVTDCDSYATGNLGCTIRSPAPAGDAFNQIGGGVFAMAWTADGISIWFFRRDAIPQDIKDGTPKHSTWGVPITTLSSSRCNSAAFFKNHSMVINTTLCGDWAGGTWSQPNPGFGQYQSAAQMTGYASCEDFVRNEGAQFANAYFEINSVKMFSLKTS